MSDFDLSPPPVPPVIRRIPDCPRPRPDVALTLKRIVDKLERALPAEVDGPRRKTLRLALEFGVTSTICELWKAEDRESLLAALYYDVSHETLVRQLEDYCEENNIPYIKERP